MKAGRATRFWMQAGTKFLPFADAATDALPLNRLLRLSLFQVSVGMAFVLLNFTLNRVMIVELGVPATLVAAMVALPLLFAPARALIGFKSDNHASVIGWRRVPYIWMGTLFQFGGLAFMPFALLLMSGRGALGSGVEIGTAAACLSFLMVGAGMALVQTAGLALATDLAPEASRPRVVALLYVMLLVGMFFSSVLLGNLLHDFDPNRLVGVIQGTAVVTAIINLTASWKQEARVRGGTKRDPDADFSSDWRAFVAPARTRRLLVALGLGAAGFGMQDILLEPYGGHVLGLSVGQTTALSALWSAGMIGGFAYAARALARHADPHKIAGFGALVGIAAFAMVVFSAPLASPAMLCVGVGGIGLGGGLFAIGTLIATMDLALPGKAGLALGAWGAVQASAAGVAILLSGALRDSVGALAMSGRLGAGMIDQATGYSFVWHVEIGLLFATLVALGPLARRIHHPAYRDRLGLSDFPLEGLKEGTV
ncbi:BCD family MFS transporter [Sphingomonas sp. 28-63-12]|uniref:BCD family MFS transporter n=1 Tax=Sphingomonas sp. 28-63-12 TaxID=1970434 RepID=UPI000BC432A0|nr:MAG: MFS transporter [Sphingomonas sp. 28-63-12]